jgi:DNA (cytosine-5)-methyltransferase 1
VKPLLLDLFCGAGGAAMGYHRAGFDVLGVDIVDQPHYPFEFHQCDALEWMRNMDDLDIARINAIHASPPCQPFTPYRRRGEGVGDRYLNVIPQTRDLLARTGLPYVIENVEAAKVEGVGPVMMCGSAFGLDVQRHRMFESNVFMFSAQCDHSVWTPRFPQATNRKNLRKTVEVGVWRIPLAVQQRAMGIDWMTLPELSEAIPPAYTEYIGAQLLESIGVAA